MRKDPAVLFYVQDFLIGSSLLTPIQKGHYITLLCYQQQSDTGSLSADEIKSLMQGDFTKHWPVIKRKFQEDENGFFNSRMRSEILRRKSYSDSRRNNRLAKDMNGHMTDDMIQHMNKDIGDHMSGHMEPPIEIEVEKGVKGEKQNVIFDVEQELLKNQIAFEKICMSAHKTATFAKRSLRKFHLHLQQHEKYPASIKSLFAGFEKWLMNEKIENDTELDTQSSLPGNLKRL